MPAGNTSVQPDSTSSVVNEYGHTAASVPSHLCISVSSMYFLAAGECALENPTCSQTRQPPARVLPCMAMDE
ncbi:MAG TPA: hypothetical protein PKI32_09080, partial [Opitutales bacterium]|nr:hypothetical protein [Opitutales bacterium]